MTLFVSTKENPLNFFKCYLYNKGEEYLFRKFQSASESNFFYNPDRDTIYIQKILPRGEIRGELLDEETNTCEFEIRFEEFVITEFKFQLKTTIDLINELCKVRSDDLKLDLYKQILIEGLEIKKEIDNQRNLNFRFYIDRSILYVLKFSYRKFEKYHPGLKQMHEVELYIKSQKSSNVTGFKRTFSPNNIPLRDIYDRMRDDQFVRCRIESFRQFMKGELPNHRIEWLKTPSELRYFIYELAQSGTLEKRPGQIWKHMNSIFTYQGHELPENWHRNNNKLHDLNKKDPIDRIINMFLPR